MPSEPSDAGFCGILSEPSTRGLKAATCINPLNGSVCERPGKYMGEWCIMEVHWETVGGVVNYWEVWDSQEKQRECLFQAYEAEYNPELKSGRK